MSFAADLTVNLLDPEDVREKAARLRGMIEDREAEVERLRTESDHWKRLLERLEALDISMVPANGSNGSNGRSRVPTKVVPGSTQDVATKIVLEMNEPMRTGEVMEYMSARGHDVPSKGAVNTALWASEKAGLLSKLAPGLYAPPDYEHPAPEGGGRC